VARCRRLRTALERVKRLESAVASAAGLAMLFADPEIALTSEYLRLLESLAAAASERGQLAGGALRDLPVRVRASSGDGSASSSAQDASRLSADEDLGVVIASVDASAHEVLAYLEVRSSPVTTPWYCHAHSEACRFQSRRGLQACIACRRQRHSCLQRIC